MDKVFEAFSQKILGELKIIKSKIDAVIRSLGTHDTVGPPRQEHHRTSEGEHGPNQRTEDAGAHVSTGIPEIQPPVNQDKSTTNKQVKSFQQLRRLKPLIEAVGVLFLVIYTGITTCRLSSKEANRIANDALRTTKDQFLRDQTPYVVWDTSKSMPGVNIYPVGQILSSRQHYSNVGRSIAIDVRTYGCMFMVDKNTSEPEINRIINTAFVEIRKQTRYHSKEDVPPGLGSFYFREIWLTEQTCPPTMAFEVAVRKILSVSENDALTAERLSVYAIAGISYADLFGNTYETQGCFIYSGLSFKPRPPNQLVAMQLCREHNTLRKVGEAHP